MAKVSVDLNVLADIANRGCRRAAAFTALGRKAWSDEALHSLAAESPISVRFLPDPLPADLSAEVRKSFKTWIIGNALTEIVQGLGLFADEYYQAATYLKFHGKKISADAIKRIDQVRNDTNVRSKLDAIQQEPKVQKHEAIRYGMKVLVEVQYC